MSMVHDSTRNYSDIPSVTESERIIEQDAPVALQVLEKYNALDLAEALGLSNYLNRCSK